MIFATHNCEGNAGYVFDKSSGRSATATIEVLQQCTSLAWVVSSTTIRLIKVTTSGTIECAGGVAIRLGIYCD